MDNKHLLNFTVTAILGIIIIAIVLAFSGVFAELFPDNTTCSIAVRDAVFANKYTGKTLDISDSCQTTDRDVTDKDAKEIKNLMVRDYTKCFVDFGVNEQLVLIDDEKSGTICHVCAIYYSEKNKEVTGVAQEISKYFEKIGFDDEGIGEATGLDQSETFEEVIYKIEQPTAIMFYQTKDFGDDLMAQLFAKTGTASGNVFAIGATMGVGAAKLGAVGCSPTGVGALVCGTIGGVVGAGTGLAIGWFYDPQANLASGIIIRNYDKEALQKIGCTMYVDEEP